MVHFMVLLANNQILYVETYSPISYCYVKYGIHLRTPLSTLSINANLFIIFHLYSRQDNITIPSYFHVPPFVMLFFY